MNKMQILKEESIKRILGKIEIETIIKKIEGKTLKQTERNYLSRSIRPKLLAAKLLCQENILEEINKDHKEDNSLIEYNLSYYDYDLLLSKKIKSKKITIEELIIRILVKMPYARFIEAIPIIIIKNKVNSFRLLELAANYGIKNKIGYLLETAFMIKKIPYLKDLLAYLEKNKDKEPAFLVEGDYDFLKKTSPERVQKWNLLGRFFDEDFIKNAKVYV
jgi:hypothetical protein